MNTLRENEVIDEINCGNNFGYVLKDNNYFVNTDYKVLQSQSNDFFLKCMKMTHNGNIEFYYVTDEYVPISNIINGVPADTLMNILLNLIGAVIEVRNNGFLSFQNIDMEWHRVYVDMNTLKVKLAYVPVNYPLYNNYPEFENDLKSEMIKLVNSVSARGTSSEKFEKFVWGLSSGKLSLVDVYNQLKVGGMQPVHKYPDPIDPPDPGPNPNPGPGPEPDPNMWGIPLPPLEQPKSFLSLVLINGMQPVTITLSRECTVIGKKRELVDECITFNNMISRKHCSIVRQGDKYFITDEASSNGTFVNGSRLVPKQYYQINRGDVIRMADSDFQLM